MQEVRNLLSTKWYVVGVNARRRMQTAYTTKRGRPEPWIGTAPHALTDDEQVSPASPHPHADATYRVVALDDGTFAVEVVIPDTFPTRVIGLPSQDAADAYSQATKPARSLLGTLKRRQFRPVY
jgi:hypothetical protein